MGSEGEAGERERELERGKQWDNWVHAAQDEVRGWLRLGIDKRKAARKERERIYYEEKREGEEREK